MPSPTPPLIRTRRRDAIVTGSLLIAGRIARRPALADLLLAAAILLGERAAGVMALLGGCGGPHG